LEVWWEGDSVFYQCTVTGYNEEGGTHRVAYDDGEVDDLDLSIERYNMLPIRREPAPVSFAGSSPQSTGNLGVVKPRSVQKTRIAPKPKPPPPHSRATRSRGPIKLPDRFASCARVRPYNPAAAKEDQLYKPKNKSAVRSLRAAQSVSAGFATSGIGAGAELTKVDQGQRDRHYRLQMRKFKGTDVSDIWKVNQLKERKKRVKFGRSKMHAWGLFADEAINKEEFVIEYIGELVRPTVADRREADYNNRGWESSYLFKLDDGLTVDATIRGGAARFINHSCDPNCYTKIIVLEGQKRIVIYSRRVINPGEELTYDYHFDYEEDKVPCHCGAAICRGFLN